MNKKLLMFLILGMMILGMTGCNLNKENNDNNEIVQEDNQKEILTCLENELGGYIVTEKDTLKELSLDEITDKKDKISYYKGFMTNDDNMYVIYTGTITYEYEVMKDFDLYFAKRFSTYQKYLFNNGIYILIHNNFNDIDFNELENKCNINNLEIENIKKIPNKTINKLSKTNKIVIKSGNNELGIINDIETIKDILGVVSTSEQHSYKGSDVAYLCDGHAFDFEMYNDKGKLIDTIYVWHDGGRLIPKSLESGCSYYSASNDNIDLREIIEVNTNYKFYGLSDYEIDCDNDLEQIYEDENYQYYLNCKKSDKVLIHFDLSNLTMTLKYALNNNYIKINQLEGYNNLLIKKDK